MRPSRLTITYFAISIVTLVLLVALSHGGAATTHTLTAIEPGAETTAAEPLVDAEMPATLELPPDPRRTRAPREAPILRAVNDAHAAGAQRFSRLAVAVLDLRSGRLYTAGDVDARYPSASLVKVFIAARLLVEGRAGEAWVQETMRRMIVCSDDNAGSVLYDRAGGDGLMRWISERYGIAGLTPPSIPGYWGTTGVTARAMVYFYAKVTEDPVAGPWLRDAMGRTQAYGCDGFYQHFGLASAAAGWQVKQGWMCCLANLSRMHSTGYVNDRYAVALLAEGGTWTYGGTGAQALTQVAQTLLPGGVLPDAR
jgi:hypothetical protein